MARCQRLEHLALVRQQRSTGGAGLSMLSSPGILVCHHLGVHKRGLNGRLGDFTNWTFVGMAVHAVVGIMQSVRGIRRGARRSSAVGWKWLPYDWFDKLHSGIGSSIISISLHVAIFYWAALNPGSVCASCRECLSHRASESRTNCMRS